MHSVSWGRAVAALLLFGISFGYVEAAVVVYLRTIYDPVRVRIRPEGPPGDLFPLITPDQLRAAMPERTRLLSIEMVREGATLAMLAAVALAVSVARLPWLPAFAIAFGTWDFFFYVFLKVLIDWPASLMTWDILFLVPVPWAAPVLAPVIVSLTIVGCGVAGLARPVRMSRVDWGMVVSGNLLILASFMGDYRNLMAGGMPHPFLWWVFGAGEVVGVGGFLRALGRVR